MKTVIYEESSTWPPEDVKLLFVVEERGKKTEVTGEIRSLEVQGYSGYDEDLQEYYPCVDMDEDQRIKKEDGSWVYAKIISWQRIEGKQP